MSTATDPLAALGVQICEPIGDPKRYGAWTTIGSLVVEGDGPVEVIPCRDISATDHGRLIAAAGQVWLHGRAGFSPEHWTYHSGLGWVIDVMRRSDDPDAEQAQASAERYCLAGGVR